MSLVLFHWRLHRMTLQKDRMVFLIDGLVPRIKSVIDEDDGVMVQGGRLNSKLVNK